MTRTTTAITTVATGVLLAATLTACSDGEDRPVVLPSNTGSPSAASTPTATPVPGTTSKGTAQQQVLAAYLGMQNAFLKASETANPDYPELSKHAADTALQRLTTGLNSMRAKGLRSRGETTYRPAVESLAPAKAPTAARVRDCMDTSKTEAYKANGDPYKDTPGGLRLVIADLQHVDGAWKVTGLGVHEVGSCVR